MKIILIINIIIIMIIITTIIIILITITIIMIFMNKPVNLGLWVSKINKIVTYEFWYEYASQKYGEKMMQKLHVYRQHKTTGQISETLQKMLK